MRPLAPGEGFGWCTTLGSCPDLALLVVCARDLDVHIQKVLIKHRPDAVLQSYKA